jgi:processive 1,2-diacylglycerol beta-glucosyltransferase
MAARRFLLLHITGRSGHHRASCAIAQTLSDLDPRAVVVNVDAFDYTSPFVRWAITRTYVSLIRHQPDIWEYLYDNPGVHRRIHYFRALLHRYQAAKFGRLLDEVRPDAIVCTQAYPCGIAADFKKHHGMSIPLIGVLTDYAPHLYWFHETVDTYVVPSEQVKRRFVTRGVDPSRVKVLGIPIDPRFAQQESRAEAVRHFGLDPSKPILLLMGGGTGFGQLRDIVRTLDTLPQPCQLVVIAGTNRQLLSWLQGQRYRHPVRILGYTDEVPTLMAAATLIVSKPGGLTTSEALARHLPLVIVNPIPGQEAYNARFLLSEGAAVQAVSPWTARQTVRDLLDNPEQLDAMRRRAAELAHPAAAQDIATLLFDMAGSLRSAAPAVKHVPEARDVSAGSVA